MTENSGGAFYKDYPQTCDPNDYWSQVGRTVNGKPVDQAQIDMIVTSACRNLEICGDDFLLDLCCGNGALTTYFYSRCRGGVGVDFSEFLIDVAKRRFQKRETESYVCTDVVEFARTEARAAQFTKGLCYGAFQLLPNPAAMELLALLRGRFVAVRRLYIGNLPDKDRLKEFYANRPYTPGIENRADSPIGIWRTAGEFSLLAEEAGWTCSISRMPAAFYGADYRFDALLTPA